MNSVIDLLKSHRSIRRYKNQALEEGVLEQLILAGQAASTSSYIQATSVIRITDASVRQAFVELSGNQPYISSAAEFLVFCSDFERNYQRIQRDNNNGENIDFGWTEQFISATVDVALFAQNVVIAAESQGLGCCYIGGIRNDLDKVTELLDLPKRVYPVFGLCIGVADQSPMIKPRLPLASVLHEDKYALTDVKHVLIDEYDQHIREYYQVRSKGRLDQTWSQQMLKQSVSQTRAYMKKYLIKQGFIDK